MQSRKLQAYYRDITRTPNADGAEQVQRRLVRTDATTSRQGQRDPERKTRPQTKILTAGYR